MTSTVGSLTCTVNDTRQQFHGLQSLNAYPSYTASVLYIVVIRYKTCSKHTLRHAQTLALKSLPERVAELLGVRRMYTGLAKDTVEDELDGDTAWHTDSTSHCGVTGALAVELEGRGQDVLIMMSAPVY
jgi:hypothetical protein